VAATDLEIPASYFFARDIWGASLSLQHISELWPETDFPGARL
jgi:hypothetical protein